MGSDNKDRNPLTRVNELGQSVWLDLLSRNLIESGDLRKFIEKDSVTGVTSNPAIFEKAMSKGDEYDEDIRRLSGEGRNTQEIYVRLATKDIQDTADLLRPIFDRTNGVDGYVSLEVSPGLARDTAGTIREAKELWSAVQRPNVMIKIPATREGLPAIEECIADGINVNVTLLFGLPRYREVAEAYIHGLERRGQRGQDLRNVRSVASFFVSRIDVMIDKELDRLEAKGGNAAQEARQLRGEVAIASAKLAYQMYKKIFSSSAFRQLEQKGARKQWLLFGSTSVKTEGYSDVKYVEALIGPETVDTIPLETLEAYRDHGKPEVRLEQDLEKERETMAALQKAGIDIDEITQRLEDEGIDKFIKPFEKMMNGLAEKTRTLQEV